MTDFFTWWFNLQMDTDEYLKILQSLADDIKLMRERSDPEEDIQAALNKLDSIILEKRTSRNRELREARRSFTSSFLF